jgi:hypothetical protein
LTAYIAKAGLSALIRDPKAVRTWPGQRVPGFDRAALSDQDIAAVIAYLERITNTPALTVTRDAHSVACRVDRAGAIVLPTAIPLKPRNITLAKRVADLQRHVRELTSLGTVTCVTRLTCRVSISRKFS